MQIADPILDVVPRNGPSETKRQEFCVQTPGKDKSYLTRYIELHSICFFLYAILGKGFAYVGYRPLFIGEALLFYGICVAVGTTKLARLAQTPIGILLALFSVWELARTLPFLAVFGIETLRDAMLWGYSIFAWVVACIVLRSDNCLAVTLVRYRRYGGTMLVLMFSSFLASLFFSEWLPTWPGTEVTIPFIKPGEMCVHLAGLLVFVLVGLGTRRTWWTLPALCALLAGGSFGRGGMFACVSAVGTSFLLYPDFRRVLRVAPPLLIGLGLLLGSNFSIEVEGRSRVLSASQLVKNVESALGFGSGNIETDLDETRQWRIDWWTTIIDYTLRGPYFWTGKGFGINLTVADGVGADEESFPGLRSPHNSHLTFLARSGVPGVLLWITLQATWTVTILRGYRLARREGRGGWARLFVWIFAYWMALTINAAFDVSLEGPVCGIAFWTMFGLGWGSWLRFRRETYISPGPAPTKAALGSEPLGPTFVARASVIDRGHDDEHGVTLRQGDCRSVGGFGKPRNRLTAGGTQA